MALHEMPLDANVYGRSTQTNITGNEKLIEVLSIHTLGKV